MYLGNASTTQKNSQITRLHAVSSSEPGVVPANSRQPDTASQSGASRSSIRAAQAGFSVAASASRRGELVRAGARLLPGAGSAMADPIADSIRDSLVPSGQGSPSRPARAKEERISGGNRSPES